MKEILAIVRLNRMNQTKRALSEAGISSVTARDALGRGKGLVDRHLLEGAQKGYEEAISQLGQNQRLVPKRVLILVVPDELVDRVVTTIIRVNQTGEPGDGKIFVLPGLDAIRVRTGESGDAVLDDVQPLQCLTPKIVSSLNKEIATMAMVANENIPDLCELDGLDPEKVKKELIKKYPPKVARKRAKQIVVNKIDEDGVVPEIGSNVRTVPGLISQRGCCYAGCKGVVLGPTRDIINITHGPVGCGFYSWLTRRNQTDPDSTPDGHNFMTYCFTTDMQDEEIIFGGEKKLKLAIQEAFDNFHPKAIAVFSTCPVGLIGDDVHAVCREMKEKLGINVFGFSCEGYKGVSQSAGHHIANNGIFNHVVGTDDTVHDGEFKINLLGEYNIGGDAFEIERLFDLCGFTLISTFSGNSSIDKFANSHTADLNLIMCHRSINYVAEMMETKYGLPWIKVNFIGGQATAKSLRKMAAYFEDQKLMDRVEEVIASELPAVEQAAEEVRQRTQGKRAMLFVGGSRAHHYQELFKEIGMKTLSAGYEFAHRDDYEGRRVLPDIKVDADSRNIQELEVEPDAERYNPRKSEEALQALEEQGLGFSQYQGMMPEMENGALVIDDISQHETERMIAMFKPDIFCAGIKEKYVVQKLGVPLKQLHSYDYGGPYAGFQGAINFYQEIDRMVSSRVWSYLKAPWQKNPELAATYGTD